MPLTGPDRPDNLRYALQQLEQWMERWEAGQELTARQVWHIGRAAFTLRGDRGERHDPAEIDLSGNAAIYLKSIDPDRLSEPDSRPDPQADYRLDELRRDLADFRTKFAYLGNEGGARLKPRLDADAGGGRMTGILKALGAIAGTVKIAYGLVRAWSLWMAADAWSELTRRIRLSAKRRRALSLRERSLPQHSSPAAPRCGLSAWR